MTSRILVTASLACFLACSLPWRVPELSSTENAAESETRFAVLPINAFAPIAPELSGSKDRVLGRITRYLSVQGHERGFIEESATQRLWRESIAEVEASHSASPSFHSAIGVFAARLGESVPFDALVVASLVYRQANLARRLVKWDGVVRRLRKLEAEGRRVPESYGATVSALSLHVMVFDARGELVFENYGGLDLAHAFSAQPRDGGLEATLLETILGQERFLNEGVEVAFEPYLPRPPSSRW